MIVNRNRYKKALVTGGAGFIGSHLVDALIESGFQVSVIDDLCTGSMENLNKDAIFYKTNTTNNKEVIKIFKKVKPDIVCHLAANTNVPLSVRDPLYDFQTLQGSLNIIDACRYNKTRKIVYVSSGFIYGNTKNRPTKESEPSMSISPYAISKKTIETYLQFYKKTYKLPCVILRPATVYGPRQTKGAMADYMEKLSIDEQAEMYGDGSKTRDYLFIDDMIAGVLKLVDLPIDYVDPVFNIGTGKETSLKELYCIIADLLNKKADPVYMPGRPGELIFYSLDFEKLKLTTNWEPKHEIEEGMRLTLKFRNFI